VARPHRSAQHGLQAVTETLITPPDVRQGEHRFIHRLFEQGEREPPIRIRLKHRLAVIAALGLS
jgi:hypothetical protein